MSDPDELVLSTVDDIRTIDRASWDALLPPDASPFLRHTFLATLEETGCVRPEVGWLPIHLTIRRKGQLIAAAPMYLKGNFEGEFVFDHGWQQYASRLGIKYYPKMVVAVPFTPATGRRLLTLQGAEAPELEALLTRGLRAACEQLGMSSVHVLFPDETNAKLLDEEGFAMRHGIQFHWKNQGYKTYDDFLASFNSKRRHQIKRERREVEKSGVVTTTYRGREITEEVLDAMIRFYIEGVERHAPWGRQYLSRSFFEKICDRMPEHMQIVLAREAGKPIAGCFNVESSTRLYGRYWGSVDHRPFLHFHVCYYHSIEWCIDHQIQVFEPGAGGEHKLPRGFDPTRTFSAHHLVDKRLDRAIRAHLTEERAHIARTIAGEDEGED